MRENQKVIFYGEGDQEVVFYFYIFGAIINCGANRILSKKPKGFLENSIFLTSEV